MQNIITVSSNLEDLKISNTSILITQQNKYQIFIPKQEDWIDCDWIIINTPEEYYE